MARSTVPALTEYESHVLAIIARDGPATAYKVRKILAESPSAGISSSAGAVYPAVARLKARKFISSAAVDTDGRNTELLTATEGGRAAIRRWIEQVTPEQLLPVDPLRTRVAHAQMLSSQERFAWLKKMKDSLEEKLAEIEAYSGRHSEGAIDYAHRHAKRITIARIAWIEEILALENHRS